MPELDHLVVAAADLEEGVARLQTLTGVEATYGGPHPGIGTHNALLSLGASTYLEVIAIDPSQPEPSHPRPFGLEPGLAPTLVGVAIHPVDPESIEEVVARMVGAGFDPGAVSSMGRVRPDGVELTWRLTRSKATSAGADLGLPFVIDWGSTETPAASAPVAGSLRTLSIRSADARVREVWTALGVAQVEVVDADGRGPGLGAVIDSPAGVIEL